MKYKYLALSIMAACSIPAQSAMAQTPPSTDSDFSLEEIIVTAERREADMQDTPISISSMNAGDIEKTGAGSLDQLADFIPNLNITASGAYGKGNPEFNIRGVGAGTSTAGAVTEKPVGLYIDGLYYSRAQGALLSLIDAERIDVLKGPQGTLFGRNTTGGAIAYTSKMPTQEFEGYVKGKFGQYNQRDLQGMVNIPLSDTTAIKLSAAVQKQDGYVDRGPVDMGNTDDSVLRLQLRSELSDDIQLDFQVSHSETKSNGDARDISSWELGGTAFPRNFFQGLNVLLQAQGEAPLVENDPRLVLDDYTVANYCTLDDLNPLTFGSECKTDLEGSMDVVSAKIKWDLNEDWSLTSITGFLAGEQSNASDWTWTGGYYRPVNHDFDNYSQEFQLSLETDDLKFVTGLIYFHEDAREDEITREVFVSNAIAAADNDINDVTDRIRRKEEYQSLVDSVGVFAQATYSVTEQLDVTAGIRYSSDEKEVTIERFNTPFETNAARKGTGTETWDDVGWRLAASYNLSDDIMLYASATDAYKAGIADDSAMERSTNVDNLIPFIPPEEALGFEIGLRSEWLDNRLRLNLTAYKTEYTNRQSTRIITIQENGEDRAVIESINLGDVDFEGFEADFAFAATENLTISGSIGISDYEQIEAPDEVLPGVPKTNWTLGFTHEKMLSNGATLDSTLRYGYTDDTYSDQGNTTKDRQTINDGYGLLSGRLEYNSGENWIVALYGTNLLDENYSTSSAAQTFHIGGSSTATETRVVKSRYMGRPRSVGIEVKYNF
jgi:iron complex outermembrane receptor protein